MKDIREHQEEIDALRSEFLNKLSNLFGKPINWNQGIWTKDDEEAPIPGKNCIHLMLDWD